MADNVQNYISSGILEAYVMGSLSAQEEQEVMQMRQQHPEVSHAISEIESDLEALAMNMAINPPPVLWDRVEGDINDLIKKEESALSPSSYRQGSGTGGGSHAEPLYIEVEAQSEYIKVHKLWRWAFIAVFALGKLFLATAIYFYVENRHNRQQLQETQLQLRQLQQLHR